MPAIATLKNGGFIAVWTTNAGEFGDSYVMARVFEADAQPKGDAFRLANPGFGIQGDPSVAALDDGRVVVAWTDSRVTSSPARAAIVHIQPDGTASIGRSQFTISSPNVDNQHEHPTIAALPGGGFLVSATGDRAGSTFNSATSYVYDGQGNVLFANEEATSSPVRDVAISALEGGSKYVTVFGYGGGSTRSDYGIVARIYSATQGGSGVFVNIKTGDGFIPEFAVTTLEDGRFLVAWTEGDAVLARIYNSNGSVSKNLFTLYDSDDGATVHKIAIQAIDGGLVLACQAGDDVFVKTWNINNQDVETRSTAVTAHEQASGTQGSPSISVLADGRFVVNWTDGAGVQSHIFDDRQSPVNVAGTNGNDKFYGSALNDTLHGGSGDDVLDGGDGNDLFMAEETPDVEGKYDADIFNGGAGTEDKIAYWYAGSGIHIDLDAQDENAGAAEGDRIHNDIEIIDGSTHNDTIVGDANDNAFWGNRGNDILIGGAGNDSIKGGDGNDRLDGGTGNDLFWGEGDDDFMVGGSGGNDTFVGGDGQDTVSYASAAGGVTINLTTGVRAGAAAGDIYDETVEIFEGSGDADSFDGDTRDNVFWAGDGNDVLRGHGGNDVLTGGRGQDAIDGGNGSDTVVLTGSRANYDVTLNQDGSITLTDKRQNGDGVDTIRNIEIFQFSDSKASLLNIASGVERILTSDVVAENSAAGIGIGSFLASAKAGGPLRYDLVDDAQGRFTIDAATGMLKVADGVRLDFEQADRHTITVRMTDASGASSDRTLTILVQDVLNERAFGSAGADGLRGGAGQDYFASLAGNDWIEAGLGNDTLSGGTGKDLLTGGLGKDIFVFDTKANKATNLDKIADFSVKDDTIWLENKVFAKLGKKGSEARPAKLSKDFFIVGDKAKDGNDYLIYNRKKGVLSYDADGSGSRKAVEIATLKKGLAMTEKDFFVI